MAALLKLVNRLSPPLRETLENAVGEAIKRKVSTVETAHWLYHIIFGKNVELQAFLEDQGVSLEALQTDFEREMPFGVGADGQQPTISGSLVKLIEQAWILASVELDQGAILPEVFLLTTQMPNNLGVRAAPLAALKPMSTDALRAFAIERGQTVASASSVGAAAQATGDGTALCKHLAILICETL